MPRSGDPLSRRQLLRGLGGGAVLLGGLLRSLRAEAAPPRPRALFLFYANGSHHGWTPSGEGQSFVLTPHLAPLESLRKEIVILKNLSLQRGRGNPHKASTYSALGAGGPTSIDQLLAARCRADTPLASLELAIGFTGGGGGVAPSLSQVDGVFLPGERNPFTAYQRIAGRVAPGPGTGTPAAMGGLLVARKSVLDHVKEDAQLFRKRLGAGERAKADLFLQSVRDLENSLGNLAGDLARAPTCGRLAPPADTASFIARVNDMPKVNRLFMDLMTMALACNVTRVASMMWGGGESDEPVEFMGMRDWHITTHGDPGGAPGEKVIRMQAYLAEEFAYLLHRLQSFSLGESGRPLLDETLAVLGTQNGNTNQTNFAKEDHDRRNTPLILAGRAGGALRTGRLIDCGERNHNDVYLGVARAFGLKLKSVGEPEWNQGPLPDLFS
jgi:hypothetical protein